MTSHDLKRSASSDQIVTAVDYLASQEALKSEALETLPYDPTECSATTLGDKSVTTRQNLYACLTCRQGVCYSCSIQCHPGAGHELVELFSKRGYACGCSTESCVLKKKHRRASVSSTGSNNSNSASNSSSSSKSNSNSNNTTVMANLVTADEKSKPMTGHNFRGLFCVCDQPYNPEIEDRLMVQCCFGTACDEDWFHDSCVLDWIDGNKTIDPATVVKSATAVTADSTNFTAGTAEVEKEEDLKGPSNHSVAFKNNANSTEKDDAKESFDNKTKEPPSIAAPVSLITISELGDAAGFVCWKCVQAERSLFDLIFSITEKKPTSTASDKNDNDDNDNEGTQESTPIGRRIPQNGNPDGAYMILFADPSYKARLHALATSDTLLPSALAAYLPRFPFLFADEITYTPPLDTSADASDDEAALLNTIPRQQAIEGLKAFDGIRASLTAFLRGFAEGDRVVTEDDVTSFFENERKRKKTKHS